MIIVLFEDADGVNNRLRGRQDELKMKEAIAKVLCAGIRHKIPVGRPVGSPADRYIKCI